MSKLEEYENYLKENMPSDCIPLFKKFAFCRYKVNNYLKQTDPNTLHKKLNSPGFNNFGCEEEAIPYSSCILEFREKYQDLKNYVALIENKPQFYNANTEEEYRENLKKHALKFNPFELF